MNRFLAMILMIELRYGKESPSPRNVAPHMLHLSDVALLFMSESQFPHFAKYSVELSSHFANFALSNLCGSNSMLKSLHLNRLCFHVFLSAFLTPSGNFAQQALHFAMFVTSLFLFQILRRSASNAWHGIF